MRTATVTTFWINDFTGARLDADELGRMRRQAHDVYLRNTHIFEDEVDALSALGAVAVVLS
jgi:hypothetical protein